MSKESLLSIAIEEGIGKSEVDLLLKKIIKRITREYEDSSSEGSDSDTSLSRVDRGLAIQTCIELLTQKMTVERKNDLLTKSLLKYFKRKKIYRALSTDKSDEVEVLQRKYQAALDEFDATMATDKQFRQITEETIMDIETEKEALIAEKNNNIQILEQRLRDVGTTLQSTKTGLLMPINAVNFLIRRMNTIRDIISKVRIEHIITLDKHTEIDTKAKALEDLGNGLRMIDFEQLRAERQTLSDKIEERNNELEKLRIRCYSETQILSHVREKEFMLSQEICDAQVDLDFSVREMIEMRNEVSLVKLERDRLRKLFFQMSESCGLLDKGILLYDYDETLADSQAKQLKIDALKSDIKKITEEHNKILMQIDSQAVVKTDSMVFDEKLRRKVEYMKRPYLPRIRAGVPFARSFFRKQLYKKV